MRPGARSGARRLFARVHSGARWSPGCGRSRSRGSGRRPRRLPEVAAGLCAKSPVDRRPGAVRLMARCGGDSQGPQAPSLRVIDPGRRGLEPRLRTLQNSLSAAPDSVAEPLGAVQTIVPVLFWSKLGVVAPRTILTTFPVSVIVDPVAVTFWWRA